MSKDSVLLQHSLQQQHPLFTSGSLYSTKTHIGQDTTWRQPFCAVSTSKWYSHFANNNIRYQQWSRGEIATSNISLLKISYQYIYVYLLCTAPLPVVNTDFICCGGCCSGCRCVLCGIYYELTLYYEDLHLVFYFRPMWIDFRYYSEISLGVTTPANEFNVNVD